MTLDDQAHICNCTAISCRFSRRYLHWQRGEVKSLRVKPCPFVPRVGPRWCLQLSACGALPCAHIGGQCVYVCLHSCMHVLPHVLVLMVCVAACAHGLSVDLFSHPQPLKHLQHCSSCYVPTRRGFAQQPTRTPRIKTASSSSSSSMSANFTATNALPASLLLLARLPVRAQTAVVCY